METSTYWEDTGKDCPHCGGEISKRTDQLPDQSKTIYHECVTCGAQWSLQWTVLRRGRQSASGRRTATSTPDAPARRRSIELPTWAWVVFGMMLLFIAFRVGLIGYLRILILPLAIILLIFLVYRLGVEQEWW